jgi:glucan biosynthesis protein
VRSATSNNNQPLTPANKQQEAATSNQLEAGASDKPAVRTHQNVRSTRRSEGDVEQAVEQQHAVKRRLTVESKSAALAKPVSVLEPSTAVAKTNSASTPIVCGS